MMGWFRKTLKRSMPLRHRNFTEGKEERGTVITLGPQDLAHAVHLYMEKRYPVDALWVEFVMERGKGNNPHTIRAEVRVQKVDDKPQEVLDARESNPLGYE
jgi:hypothetical protein